MKCNHQKILITANVMSLIWAFGLMLESSVITYFGTSNIFGFIILTLIGNILCLVKLQMGLASRVIQQRDALKQNVMFLLIEKVSRNIAHSTNNELYKIQLKLDLIRRITSLDQLDLEKLETQIIEMENTIKKISNNVNNIIMLAKDFRAAQMKIMTVMELIDDALLQFNNLILDSGIRVEVQIDPLIRVYCYPFYIKQVILNILKNAITALIKSDIKMIRIQATINKNWVSISINDSGVGVPSKNVLSLFNSQLSYNIEAKVESSLFISKKLLLLHEGDLSYERSNDLTKLIIKLPSLKLG